MQILNQVYADCSTEVDEIVSHIIKTTQHPAAAASFASIIFTPQGELSFKECLTRLVPLKLFNSLTAPLNSNYYFLVLFFFFFFSK